MCNPPAGCTVAEGSNRGFILMNTVPQLQSPCITIVGATLRKVTVVMNVEKKGSNGFFKVLNIKIDSRTLIQKLLSNKKGKQGRLIFSQSTA